LPFWSGQYTTTGAEMSAADSFVENPARAYDTSTGR
jgi:hypothetical protein